MAKIHGMTTTLEIGESIEDLRDIDEAAVESAPVHGMTETLDASCVPVAYENQELEIFPRRPVNKRLHKRVQRSFKRHPYRMTLAAGLLFLSARWLRRKGNRN
jgi:hypothetical protein